MCLNIIQGYNFCAVAISKKIFYIYFLKSPNFNIL